MSKLVITESKLKNLIKEAVKTVLNENNGLTKYNVYYCEDGGSVYTDGHYQTSYNVKNDKEALKTFLNEFSKVYLANLDGDLDKTETYSICKVSIDEYGDDDIDEIWKVEFYTKNGKKVEYKYRYYSEGKFELGDSYQERNKKRYIGYITDIYGHKLIDIPEGYCKSLSLIKKFAENFAMKRFNQEGEESMYIQVCDLKTDEWTEYNGFIFDFGGDIEFSFNKAK